MPRARVLYEATGWGVGELLLDGNAVLWHEHPEPGREATGRHPLSDRVVAYLDGARDTFQDVELDLTWCTPFQLAATQALRAVPYGETVTYGELAALAGAPGAQRAAGTFCARNRFAIFVPCHRVVAAVGLGGYGSLGASYKQRLLTLESAL